MVFIVIRPLFYIASVMLLLIVPMKVSGLEQRCNDKAETSTPTERFIKNNDGLLFDKATRLEWQTCVRGLTGNRCQNGTVRYFT